MASTIQIKRGTGSAVPSGLADGELAINLDNGKLYFGSGSTSVNSFRFTNLTADNYIVSSSVTNYTFQTLSGSSDFGDDVGDIHNRTGSLNISGALSMNGDIELSNNDKIFVGSGGTEITAVNDDYWTFKANGVEGLRILNNSVVVNEGGQAITDFRVESDSDTHLLFVDAGANKMAIGTDTVSDSLLTVDGDVKATNITASVISASGDIIANETFLDNGGSVYFGQGTSNEVRLRGVSGELLILSSSDVGIRINPGAGHITASGDISSSGTIIANQLEADQLVSHVGDANTGLQFASDTVIIQGNDENIATFATNRIEFTEHITASCNISSSGNLITTTLQFSGTDTSEDATHYLEFKKPGNTVSNITNGVTINPSSDTLVLGGTTTIAGQAGTITGLTSLTSTNITASGNISASGEVIANTLRFTSGANDYIANLNDNIVIKSKDNSINLLGIITASGDISASGVITTEDLQVDTITNASAGGGVVVDAAGFIGLDSSNGDIRFRDAGVNQLHFDMDGTVGAQVISPSVVGDDIIFKNQGGDSILTLKSEGQTEIHSNITSSGNISSSGTITANAGVITTLTSTNVTASSITSSGIISGKLGTTDSNANASHYAVLQTAVNTEPLISNAFYVNPSTDILSINIAHTARNKFAISNNADGNSPNGDVVYFGGTTSMTAGAIYHYNSSGAWELADADDNTKSDGLLGVALGAASDTNGVLLRGMVTLDHDPGAVGEPIYLTTTAGDASSTAPSGNGNIVRIIGYCLDASNGQIWFNPDSTFVEVNA